jgi:TPP-dependent pyruvate/acetoin dehydrogenase alpha subunit
MFRIRRAEESLLDLFSKGLLTGTTHTSIGQEACAVGVINAVDRVKDIIFSNHRGHGHFIAYCQDLVGLFGELMGKSVGVCGGISGSQHLCKNNFYTNGIQGGIVPVATGMAFAEKLKDTGAIVIVFIGDGTLGQNVVYESLNIASLWKLPILLVLEDNQYAQSTPSFMQHSGNLAKRAEPFEIKSAEVEAQDVMKVYLLARDAIEYVRYEKRPFFLVLHTYRLSPHSKEDDFRPSDEIVFHRKTDPLLTLRNKLIESNITVRDIETGVEKEISSALEIAIDSKPLDWADFRNELT